MTTVFKRNPKDAVEWVNLLIDSINKNVKLLSWLSRAIRRSLPEKTNAYLLPFQSNATTTAAWHFGIKRKIGSIFIAANHSLEKSVLSNPSLVEADKNKRALRILHLEDDPLDVELIESELKEHGISCIITPIYTREAFEAAFQEDRVDLIFSDSNLPCFDTLSALKWVREFHPLIPFVFISGNRSPKAKSDALAAGATDFLDKSDLKRLIDSVSVLVKDDPSQKNPTRLPAVGTPVMVQCKEFRCLGYWGNDRKWHAYKDSSELPEVTNWWLP